MLRRACPATRRGATIVEFAVVAPLLFALLFGIVELSLLYNRQLGLHAAAREGGRLAALPTATATQVRARVQAALTGVALSAPPTVTITPNLTKPCDQRAGQDVVVTVSAPITVRLPGLAARTVTLRSTGDFLCE